MKVVVVGVIGFVGMVMCWVFEERNLLVFEFLLVVFVCLVGKMVKFKGVDYKVISMEDVIVVCFDIVIFFVGGGIFLEFVFKFVEVGIMVIDNFFVWCMDLGKKLVVLEINGREFIVEDKIIVNFNCLII